jgi:hypothetical protein
MRGRSGWLASSHLVLALAVAGPFAPSQARGAAASDEARLAERLDAETAAAVRRVVADTRSTGLPTRSLVAKALEGATKRASGPRIVAAVGAHAAALASAREALGAGSSEDEIIAGAGALAAGVPSDTLGRLRDARRGSLVVPLVVLADLVARRVPGTTASTAVLEAARAGARDEDLLALRSRVERDIAAGASPATAATLRSRALVLSRSRPPVEASRPRAPTPPVRGSP